MFAQSIETRCKVENEDVVGAAQIGDAPTTSEWSTILLPTKVRLVLEVWRYARKGLIQDKAYGNGKVNNNILNVRYCIWYFEHVVTNKAALKARKL